jgi:hypothetical protein
MKSDSPTVQALLKSNEYKDSIMVDYFNSTNNINDIETLYECIKKWDIKNNPRITFGEDHVLVHLRTGDDYIQRGLANKKNFDFYVDEINKYNKDKTIHLVTAMHYGHHRTDKSLCPFKKNEYSKDSYTENINLLNKLINKIDREVNIISSENIDLDLAYLTLCNNLIATPEAGGFSRIILDLNKIHNETI